MEADGREPQPLEVGHVVADRLFVVQPALLQHLVVNGERDVVVDAEQRHLAAVILPSQHALTVHGRHTAGGCGEAPRSGEARQADRDPGNSYQWQPQHGRHLASLGSALSQGDPGLAAALADQWLRQFASRAARSLSGRAHPSVRGTVRADGGASATR